MEEKDVLKRLIKDDALFNYISIANLNSTPIWNLILQIFFLSTVEFNLSE